MTVWRASYVEGNQQSARLAARGGIVALRRRGVRIKRARARRDLSGERPYRWFRASRVFEISRTFG